MELHSRVVACGPEVRAVPLASVVRAHVAGDAAVIPIAKTSDLLNDRAAFLLPLGGALQGFLARPVLCLLGYLVSLDELRGTAATAHGLGRAPGAELGAALSALLELDGGQ